MDIVGTKVEPYCIKWTVFEGGRIICFWVTVWGIPFVIKEIFLYIVYAGKKWGNILFCCGDKDRAVFENTFSFETLLWVFIWLGCIFGANWWILVGVFTDEFIYKGKKFDGLTPNFYKDILLKLSLCPDNV